MASTFNLILVRNICTSSRLLKTLNIQKPHPPWTERRILNAVSIPILPPDERTLPMKCFDEMQLKLSKMETELTLGYKAFKKKQIMKMLNENVMIAICHILPLIPREAFNVKAKIVTANMGFVKPNNKLMSECIEGTKFRNLEPYCTSDTVYITSTENKVTELISILRKTPELILLGGLVENTIMSRDMMMSFAKLPPIEVLQGELLSILSAPAGKTYSLLSRPTQLLTSSLGQLVKQSEEGQGDKPSEAV